MLIYAQPFKSENVAFCKAVYDLTLRAGVILNPRSLEAVHDRPNDNRLVDYHSQSHRRLGATIKYIDPDPCAPSTTPDPTNNPIGHSQKEPATIFYITVEKTNITLI